MQNRTLKPCCPGGALPYHMGNAGDLLKHGMLAEFVRWRCESLDAKKPFRFVDPFGGLPFCGNGGAWCDGKNPAIGRFCLLKKETPDCALVQAQPDIPDRYYGSGHVVRLAAGGNAKVLFSDQCPNKREILSREGKFGFTELKARRFDPRDGYSALNAINHGDLQADLVLIDPFSDFLKCRQDDVLPRIKDASEKAAIVLFVLDMDTGKRSSGSVKNIGKQWRGNRGKFMDGALSMSCPPLGHFDGIKYRTEVVLAAPQLTRASTGELQNRLECFAQKLAKVFCLCGEQAETLRPKIVGRDL